jgi:hypothetical protein
MSASLLRLWRPAAWLMAVGLLAGALILSVLAAVADAQYRMPTASQPAGLQGLVQELSAQLWFSYRGRIPEHRLRHAQLAEAIEAWNASSQNAADRQVMNSWLRDAMRASMAGANQPMPTTPKFTGSTAASTLPAPTESAPQSAAETKPVEPQENEAAEESLFEMPAETAPTETAPTESAPAPAGDDPFGNDPLGI